MKVLGRYRNGNYQVTIFEDGTKIRVNNEDHFSPEYPESMDIKITNQCDMNCPFCHEDSRIDGKHGDILGAIFIDSLHPYTELAIGGGNPLAHPRLKQFLQKCKELKLIPSMTVNQKHFMDNFDEIKQLCDDKLIYGLGVSLSFPDEDFLEKIQLLPNAVIHIIAGTKSIRVIRRLGNRNLKILLLGYKHFRRGNNYFKKEYEKVRHHIRSLKVNLKEIIPLFQVVSFDNLAIEQLDVRKAIPEDQWDTFYMGDDGQFTMYVDMVNQEFAQSSTSTTRYLMRDTIKEMFEVIRNGRLSS